MTYEQFIESKRLKVESCGVESETSNDKLFPFQSDIVNWALRRGRAAIFADCGMGKTAMQLEWASHIPGRVLVVAPLAVGRQTEREGEKFNVGGVKYLREDDGKTQIVVTNYEILERFDAENFSGIVLDESSILKSYTGKFRNYLIDNWGGVEYRLEATATPSPNDFMELGNHSEFLGAMSRTDMLSHFFVHDGGETQKWRIKGHAESEFWKWVCEWAVMIRKPSDLGYPDGDFVLPKLLMHSQVVRADHDEVDTLFPMPASSLQERQSARKNTVHSRVERVAELANSNDEPWLIWCDLNSESDALTKAINGAVQVKGSDSPQKKEESLLGFSDGSIRALVTKPSIAGWGMNWQHCHNMAFTGLSDSYEQFYQAVRRCWRFGQKNDVHCHIVTADIEGAVVANIARKEQQSEDMARFMVEHMRDITSKTIKATSRRDKSYRPSVGIKLPDFFGQPVTQ